MRTCACGCGGFVTERGRVKRGHNRRMAALPPVQLNPCGCGCGEMVPFRFKRGHALRVEQRHILDGIQRFTERDTVPAAPVLALYTKRYGERAPHMIARALGIRVSSARCHFQRNARMRRRIAETLLRFLADLPRLPTEKQREATRRQENRESKRRYRAARYPDEDVA